MQIETSVRVIEPTQWQLYKEGEKVPGGQAALEMKFIKGEHLAPNKAINQVPPVRQWSNPYAQPIRRNPIYENRTINVDGITNVDIKVERF